MNVIVVQCIIIYMVFCMIWCSSYIDNLWNEIGKNWIITGDWEQLAETFQHDVSNILGYGSEHALFIISFFCIIRTYYVILVHS